MSQLPQLTLFPRVSETGEPPLWNTGTGLREHLLKKPALHQLRVFKLTLAKGDEVVDVAEEGADGALLGRV